MQVIHYQASEPLLVNLLTSSKSCSQVIISPWYNDLLLYNPYLHDLTSHLPQILEPELRLPRFKVDGWPWGTLGLVGHGQRSKVNDVGHYLRRDMNLIQSFEGHWTFLSHSYFSCSPCQRIYFALIMFSKRTIFLDKTLYSFFIFLSWRSDRWPRGDGGGCDCTSSQ